MITMITIDSREQDIIQKFKTRFPDICFDIKQLTVGDIEIYTDDRKLVIERKTINDLCSSIKDGRYKEQKYRLLQEYPKEDIMYIIEGRWEFIENEMIKSSILNTLIRDNIKIFMTCNVDSTVNLVCDISKRLPKYTSEKTTDYISVLKTKNTKAEYITPKVFQTLALSQIPRVSCSIAKVIIDKYENLSNIITNATVQDISNLTHGSNQRRIGNKLAEKILEYLK